MANIKVTSKQDAWNKVNQIFPTDYEQDVQSSTRAGYPVYRSTAEGHYYDYICDLGDRLEVNLDSSHLETANIWIEEPATEEAPALSEERVAVAKRLQRAVFYFSEEYLKELENKAKEDEAVAAMQANSSKDGPVQCMVLTAEGNASVMLDCIKELHRAVHILLDKQEDVDEWMLSGITAMMDRANEMKIIKALNTPADIYVINRENVEWLVDYYKQAWPFDMAVLDESTSFKNSQSKRWKAMRRVRRFIKRMVLLTGTPSSKGLIDLWAQVYLLDCGERLGQSLSAYRERYFDPDQRSRTQIFSYKAKDGAESAVLNAISDICM